MERRLTAGAPKREDTTTERLMQEFEQRIVASPPGVCPVDMQLSFLKVCHAQTCGKCVPCRVGLGQLENLLEDVLNNRATLETLHLIKETARNIQVTADCAIGFESARMVLVGLEGFKEDYLSHIHNKRCTASFEPADTMYHALPGGGRYSWIRSIGSRRDVIRCSKSHPQG